MGRKIRKWREIIIFMALDVWHPRNYFEQREVESARDNNDIILSNKIVFH